MKKLIICLGHRLRKNGSIPKILKNRLVLCADLCSKNPGSILLLMGSYFYQDMDTNLPTEASVMKGYLLEEHGNMLKNTQIITEEKTTSSVEQLCYLRELLDSNTLGLSREDLNIIIVSSEFFSNRIKLYIEYIFGTTKGLTLISSKVPKEIRDSFKRAELGKYRKALEWLKRHIKGDYKTILKEQQEFQKKVTEGKIHHPVSQ